MNPQTPENTVIHVIANLQGSFERLQAALKYIRQSPKSDKTTRLCVIMGDLINVKKPDESMATIDKAREASQFTRTIFIRGENEVAHAEHIENPQKFEQRRLKLIQTIGANPMSSNITRVVDAHKKFQERLNFEQLAFFDSWQNSYYVGDFFFTTRSADAKLEQFSISSSGTTSHHFPQITTRTLTTSSEGLPAVNVIELEGGRMTVAVIGDRDMKDKMKRKCDLEKPYASGLKKLPNRTYHFKRAGILTLGNGECPVWRTDVTIHSMMAWDRNRLEAA